jgi:serine/threonine protein kinase
MMTKTENLLPETFEIIDELGRGGSSIVVRARDTRSDCEVAVKVLLKSAEEDRFRREARQLASISHPNVVSFLEVGSHRGRDFMVMEYVQMGELGRFAQNLAAHDILKLFIKVCDGLAHLHELGIVHRDIKPANILVDSEGCPKITDLGVARQMDQDIRLTQAGTILGTYSYLAPEQILSSSVGARADLYSLGICLFEALTSRNPFVAENPFRMLRAHLEEPPPPLNDYLPGAPESLCSLIQDLLAKEAEDRPRSARVVAVRLGEAIRDIQDSDQESHPPDWEKKLEELPDEERSVLLAVGFLGRTATLDRVGRVAFFTRHRTTRCIKRLLDRSMLDSPTGDSFRLNLPQETIEARLSPRVRRLFAQRLSDKQFHSRISWDSAPSAEDDEDWTAALREYQKAAATPKAPNCRSLNEPASNESTETPATRSPRLSTFQKISFAECH